MTNLVQPLILYNYPFIPNRIKLHRAADQGNYHENSYTKYIMYSLWSHFDP